MLKTPMNGIHREHDGNMVDFAGWEMPLFYKGTGLTEEHHQTRRSGGLFDVSHMGRLKFTGRQAGKLLDRVTSRRVRDMQPGQCRYGLMCNAQGGIHDDVIVYRMDDDEFMVVVNASNREKIVKHIESVKEAEKFVCSMEDVTLKTAMVAVQGPKVIDFISKVSKEIPSLKRYQFAVKNLLITKLIVSRTGYTGEDGVEVILPGSMVGMAMSMVMKDVNPKDPDALIKPCGLGARDTLRLEAGMPLYGHELGEETSALGTGLDFAIALDKGNEPNPVMFIGQEALLKQKEAGGPAMKLVGIRCEGKRSPRQGMGVVIGGNIVGKVTSGAPSPTLGMPIAMAYVPAAEAVAGKKLEIDTGRGERIAGETCPLPFYKPAKKPGPVAAAKA